jgi:hypothetical protein
LGEIFSHDTSHNFKKAGNTLLLQTPKEAITPKEGHDELRCHSSADTVLTRKYQTNIQNWVNTFVLFHLPAFLKDNRREGDRSLRFSNVKFKYHDPLSRTPRFWIQYLDTKALYENTDAAESS